MIDGKMLIEIRQAGFVNKGAELMLYSVLDKMKQTYPDARFSMVPTGPSGQAPFLKRAELGFYQQANLWYKVFQFGIFARLIPSKVRKRFGITLDSEVDIVIDAAGFSYSDQVSKFSCLGLADSSKRWKKNGSKVILLPQALGPYEGVLNKKSIKTVLDNVDMVFARDKVSYGHLVGVVGERSNIKISGDFTNLCKGVLPSDFNKEVNRFCIIPNHRMIDKTEINESKEYLPFMIELTRYAYEKGHQPYILVHEGEDDLMLATKIRDAVNPSIQIIKEAHPLKIKGIIGVASGVVSSRFHGLVSALSQSVPSLATGWSHKYQMLMDDYGFSEGLLNVNMSQEALHKSMDLILDEEKRAGVVLELEKNSERLKIESNKMWEDVFQVLK